MCKSKMTELYAVIGDPISHSLSPLLHQSGFEALNIQSKYDAYAVKSDELAEFMQVFKGSLENTFSPLAPINNELIQGLPSGLKQKFSGLSVTLPHKKGILNYVDQKSALVKLIGSANTLYVQDQKIMAENTDLAGFLFALTDHYPMNFPSQLEGTLNNLKSSHEFKSKSKVTSMVLGAGGVVNTVLLGLSLIKDMEKIYLSARNMEQAKQVLEELKQNAQKNNFDLNYKHIEVIPFSKREMAVELLINTIPPSDISPRNNFEGVKIAYDLTYGITKFLAKAKEQSCQIINGEQMFIIQGELQFLLWTGQELPKLASNLVKTEIAKRHQVVYNTLKN